MLEVTGLSELKDALENLTPRKIRSLMGSVMEAGATPMAEAVKANCPDAEGTLRESVEVHVRKSRGEDSYVASISFNDQPHPGSTFAGGRPASNSAVALMFEFGARTGLTLRSRSSRKKTAAEHGADTIPAEHFVQRAFTATAQQALDAMSEKASEIVAKLGEK